MTGNKFQKEFDAVKCCVIIPTYNNDQSLLRVLQDVQKITANIIVVNDGSTDATGEILAGFAGIHVISHKTNKGKGAALRNGFAEALSLGYEYAITIDSDGQHKAADMPKFIDALTNNPGSIIIGARNMKQKSVPNTSSFGHKFSNFWCWVETGKKLPDTQTGFRLYPLTEYRKMRFYTNRFEFEIEVLVRALWKGVPVTSVPVDVYYAPKGERVSHFRKFHDFARVSLLNTLLVFLAIFYYRPIMLFRDIRRKGLKELHGTNQSNGKLSSSIGFGVLMGILPIWGYQTVTALFLAHLLKLNKLIVFYSCNISIPPFIPFILFLSFKTGEFFVNDELQISFHTDLSLSVIKMGVKQYLIGATVFGILAASVSFFISYILLSLRKTKKNGSDLHAKKSIFL